MLSENAWPYCIAISRIVLQVPTTADMSPVQLIAQVATAKTQTQAAQANVEQVLGDDGEAKRGACSDATSEVCHCPPYNDHGLEVMATLLTLCPWLVQLAKEFADASGNLNRLLHEFQSQVADFDQRKQVGGDVATCSC